MPRRATPTEWAEVRTMLGGERATWVKAEDNILLGWWAITQYLGIKDRKTMVEWVDEWAFPAMKRPDGEWMSSCTAIDQWIFLAAHLNTERRKEMGIDTLSQRQRQQAAQRSRARNALSRSENATKVQVLEAFKAGVAEVERGRSEESPDPIRSTALSRLAGRVAGVQSKP